MTYPTLTIVSSIAALATNMAVFPITFAVPVPVVAIDDTDFVATKGDGDPTNRLTEQGVKVDAKGPLREQ